MYRGCSTQKTFWEGNFIPGEFTPVNMKNCGRHNIRKHREINIGEKYIILDISLKFGSMEKMKITSSDPKDYLGGLGKRLITFLGLNIFGRSKKKRQGMPLIMSV